MKWTRKQIGLVCVAILILAGCSSLPRTFQPTMPLAPETFSHSMFDAVLTAHVQDGKVNYPTVKRDPYFKGYLVQLNRVDPNALSTRNDRFAFWINAYNAFAIKGIVDGLSPNSFLGRYHYFISQKYMVGGAVINLYDLEKRLLIPDFQDPRVHFAIVCASQSCPTLNSRAYRAEDLDQQLEGAARAFINDTQKNWFDRDKKIAHLSKIFDWFAEDFERDAGSLVGYVQQYLDDSNLVKDLERVPYQVEFLEYDWGLNGIPPTSEDIDARLNK